MKTTKTILAFAFCATVAASASAVEKTWVEACATNTFYGTWSPDTVVYVDGKAEFDDDFTFTATKELHRTNTTDNIVTMCVTATMGAMDEDPTDDLGNAKVAICMHETRGFLLYTDGAYNGESWVEVAAEGVTPVSEAEYTFKFVIDLKESEYSAYVYNEGDWVALKNDDTYTFGTAVTSRTLQTVEFKGSTVFTSLVGTYNGNAEPEPEPEPTDIDPEAGTEIAYTGDSQADANLIAAGLSVSVPNAVSTYVTEQAYQSYFTKYAEKRSDGKWYAVAALNESAVLPAADETAAEEAIVAMLNADASEATVATKAGLYYWIAGTTDVTDDKADYEAGTAVIGNGTEQSLDKPTLSDEGKAFYVLRIGVSGPTE